MKLMSALSVETVRAKRCGMDIQGVKEGDSRCELPRQEFKIQQNDFSKKKKSGKKKHSQENNDLEDVLPGELP